MQIASGIFILKSRCFHLNNFQMITCYGIRERQMIGRKKTVWRETDENIFDVKWDFLMKRCGTMSWFNPRKLTWWRHGQISLSWWFHIHTCYKICLAIYHLHLFIMLKKISICMWSMNLHIFSIIQLTESQPQFKNNNRLYSLFKTACTWTLTLVKLH